HVSRRVAAEERQRLLSDPGFGRIFTDHMVRVRWVEAHGWHGAELVPYQPLTLDPGTAVLHYSQAVFEGLKAFRQASGGVAAFRADAHASRFRNSARRLALPELPEDTFLEAIDVLLDADHEWVPEAPEHSLYLRPLMFASDVSLSVHPAPGGTGAAKTGGNYAGGLLAQAQATAQGCDQVVWLDSHEHRWVEEMGGMNLCFVFGRDDGAKVMTPALTGTLLPGVTRDSLLV